MSNVWVDMKQAEENKEVCESGTALPFYASLRLRIGCERDENMEEVGFESEVTKNRSYRPNVKTKSKLAKMKIKKIKDK